MNLLLQLLLLFRPRAAPSGPPAAYVGRISIRPRYGGELAIRPRYEGTLRIRARFAGTLSILPIEDNT